MSKLTLRGWAFYINLVIGALVLPVYISMLPSVDPRPGASAHERLREIDFLGAALMIVAVTTFVIGLNLGGVVYAWSSPAEISAFVVSELATLLFGLQQWLCIITTKSRRIFPVEILAGGHARTTLIMFCTTAAGGAGIFVPVYFIPLFFQFARGDSPVQAAVRLLPFVLCGVAVTLGQGALLSRPSGRFGFYMAWFLAGGVLAAAGGVLMYSVAATSTSDAWVYGSSALLGAGVGMFSQAGFSVAQAAVGQALGSKVAAFIALGQTGGITVALAVANSLFVNGATKRLSEIFGRTLSKDQLDAAVAGDGTALFEALTPAMRALVLDAIVEAMRNVYLLIIAAGALVVTLSLGMKRERLFLASTVPGA